MNIPQVETPKLQVGIPTDPEDLQNIGKAKSCVYGLLAATYCIIAAIIVSTGGTPLAMAAFLDPGINNFITGIIVVHALVAFFNLAFGMCFNYVWCGRAKELLDAATFITISAISLWGIIGVNNGFGEKVNPDILTAE